MKTLKMNSEPKESTENELRLEITNHPKSTIKQDAIEEVTRFVNDYLKKNPDAWVISLNQLPISYDFLSNYHLDYPSKCMIDFLQKGGCRIFKKNEDTAGWHKQLKINGNRTLIELRPLKYT